MRDVVNIGLVGVSKFSTATYLPSFQRVPRARLLAVCSRVENNARLAAQAFGAKYWFQNYRDMLQLEELDAVAICTPHHPLDVHMAVALDAAKRGKHVLLEKPISISISNAYRIVKACEDHEITLMVAYNHRFESDSQKVKELLDQQVLGKVIAVSSNHVFWALPYYYIELKQYTPRLGWGTAVAGPSGRGDAFLEPPELTIDPETKRRFEESLSIAYNYAVHFINLLRFFLGDPQTVLSARIVPDKVISVAMEFPNDVKVSLQVVRTVSEGINKVLIIGERGYIEVNLWKYHFPYAFPATSLFLTDEDGTRLGRKELLFPHWNAYEKELEHFCECVLEKKALLSSGRDAIKDLHIIAAIDAAQQKQRCIRINYD